MSEVWKMVLIFSLSVCLSVKICFKILVRIVIFGFNLFVYFLKLVDEISVSLSTDPWHFLNLFFSLFCHQQDFSWKLKFVSIWLLTQFFFIFIPVTAQREKRRWRKLFLPLAITQIAREWQNWGNREANTVNPIFGFIVEAKNLPLSDFSLRFFACTAKKKRT